jgi:hypothetical protein
MRPFIFCFINKGLCNVGLDTLKFAQAFASRHDLYSPLLHRAWLPATCAGNLRSLQDAATTMDAILRFIANYLNDNDQRSPTVREIPKGCYLSRSVAQR